MTCADAISREITIGASAEVAGPTVSGGTILVPRWTPVIVARICLSGSITRAIGRLDSDSSPTSAVAKRWPASRPHNSRIVVPELPQSIAPSGARMPRRPVPWITSALPSRFTVAPSCVIAFAERPLSAPSPRPSTRTGVSDNSENKSARWPIDLSPGIATVPSSGRVAGDETRFTARASHGPARRRARDGVDRHRRSPAPTNPR